MSEHIEQLAWDLVACGERPPMHPTTCAVLRLVAAMEGVSFRKCIEIVPCDVETVRQQLNRLCTQGLVERVARKRMGRKAQNYYYLTRAGLRVVNMWKVAYNARLRQLRQEIELHEN